ncbi:hypothetical protein [Roseivirga sp. E12]|uniref:hypothetical protein n=1 Tax=Roseivirga sp. E12 TaxID=2819237 RepID=UPI001ABC5B63|nr:hypothetical protein [Roseivirga sp. E12]MBO3698326.1 hypothetical protein [Roseivirga sp. E12]
MSTQHITLSKKLMSFADADTGSEKKGFVEAGDYSLLSSKLNFPSEDTDYAQIETAGGKVWICTRWKQNSYTQTHDSPARPSEDQPASLLDAIGAVSRINFDNDDKAVEESNLVAIVKDYDGFAYDLHHPAYPYDLKGVNLPIAPPKPKQNNCCTFAEGLIVKAWSDKFPDFEWNNHRHGQMMIFSTDDYFSPVTAAVESGMGDMVDDVEAAPAPWTLVQGWKSKKSDDIPGSMWSGGHTFIIVDHHPETDKILTLESNQAFGLNGVGFRKIGMASAFNHQPPANWWDLPGVWTWAQIKNSYKARAMATLKVKGRSWSGLS